jgi:hypothetical protein
VPGRVIPGRKVYRMNRQQKTQKVLDMTAAGLHIYCVRHFEDKGTPYRLYCKWHYYNSPEDYGYHTKQIAKYSDMVLVLDHIRNFLYNQQKGGRANV